MSAGVAPAVGWVYRGSLEALHGSVIVEVRPCRCSQCRFHASRGEPLGLLSVEVRDELGFRDKMHHARPGSFEPPKVRPSV